jgi:hypothetical protein
VINYAQFFSLIPSDNRLPIFSESFIEFSQDGPSSGSKITRINNSSFNLTEIGVYLISYQASTNEPAQLGINLNNFLLNYSIIGKNSSNTQISNTVIIITKSINSKLSIQNPSGNSPITLTPFAGGTHPVSTTLTITKIA